MYHHVTNLVSAPVCMLADGRIREGHEEVPEVNSNDSIPLLIGHSCE